MSMRLLDINGDVFFCFFLTRCSLEETKKRQASHYWKWVGGRGGSRHLLMRD